MKSILSPYDDHNFNTYLLKYVKAYLRKKCYVFTKDEDERKYFLGEDAKDYYTVDDIINSIVLVGRSIRFSNQALINHAVYDLGQRFWYDSFKTVNNIVHKLFLEFQRFSKVFEVQQRKLSHNKRARQRSQGAKT